MNQTSPPDDRLASMLSRAADGDHTAWENLIAAYSGRVYGLLARQCGDRELAQELTQVTFVKLVEKLGDFAGYDERGRFEPWLFRIAMNKLRDEMRRRGRQARPMDMGPAAASTSDAPSAWAAAEGGGRGGTRGGAGGGAGGGAMNTAFAGTPSTPANPLTATTHRETLALLQQAVTQMSPADQQILHLRHTAGLSFAQIAETLDQPLGTVLARGHRALKKLRTAMEAQGIDSI